MPGTNWWVDAGGFMGMPGGTTVGGGGSTDVITARDPLDAARMNANGHAPGASYPDGYLGTITDRQQDKLMGAVQNRLTERSYQRGVHVGEKLGSDQYYWPEDQQPDSGIRREAMAKVVNQEGGTVMRVARYSPSGDPVELLTAMGDSAALPPEQQLQVAKQYGVDPAMNPLPMTMTDPGRAEHYRGLLPRYR